MKTVLTAGRYSCGLVEKEDWRLLREAQIAMYRDYNVPHILDHCLSLTAKDWKKAASTPQIGRLFILFENKDFIGIGGVNNEFRHLYPELTDSFILREKRGKSLSVLTVQARLRFVALTTTFDRAVAYVEKERLSAQTILKKCGFTSSATVMGKSMEACFASINPGFNHAGRSPQIAYVREIETIRANRKAVERSLEPVLGLYPAEA